MPYVRRDARKKIQGTFTRPQENAKEWVEGDDPEVRAFEAQLIRPKRNKIQRQGLTLDKLVDKLLELRILELEE